MLGCFLRRLLQVAASVFAANVAPKKRLNGNGVTNKTQNCIQYEIYSYSCVCVCVCVWVRVCIAKDLKMQFYFIFWLWSFKCKRRNNVATRSWNCICDHSSVLSRVECLPHVAHSGHCNSCRVLRPHSPSPLPTDNACLPGN